MGSILKMQRVSSGDPSERDGTNFDILLSQASMNSRTRSKTMLPTRTHSKESEPTIRIQGVWLTDYTQTISFF